MKLRQWGPLAFGLLCLVILPDISKGADANEKKTTPSAGFKEAQPLIDKINAHLAKRLKENDVKEASVADEAEWLRRVYLDLVGRIPRYSEVRDFLESKSPRKREELVDSLLESSGYVTNFANVWRELLLPPSNEQTQFLAQQMTPWLQKKMRDNTPWDETVRELLTVNLGGNVRNGRGGNVNPSMGQLAFYQANEFKPENLAAAVTRTFLGVKIECAQCHHHPFDKWRQESFWEFAAFFSGIRQAQPDNGIYSGGADDPDKREITIPGLNKKVEAKFLDGKKPDFKKSDRSRDLLADWVVSGENPYFAKNAVNRLWAHFFGTGLVDPVDEMGDENPASHPELLDELAKAFVKHKFDMKFVVRAITLSHAYQLTSKQTHESQNDPSMFARMSVKGLTAEQMFDSLAAATGYRETTTNLAGQGNNGQTPRQEFLSKFGNIADKRTETQTTILQALALMNGKFVNDHTSVDRSELLAAVLDFPYPGARQRVEVLFMSTLSRLPTSKEAARFVKYVEDGGVDSDPRKALADVFWALLNSSEFLLNH